MLRGNKAVLNPVGHGFWGRSAGLVESKREKNWGRRRKSRRPHAPWRPQCHGASPMTMYENTPRPEKPDQHRGCRLAACVDYRVFAPSIRPEYTALYVRSPRFRPISDMTKSLFRQAVAEMRQG